MNKKMLLKEIRLHASITNVESEAFLKSFIKIIKISATNNEDVYISNFGKFVTVKHKGRTITAINGTKISISDRNKIKFIPFKVLKDAIFT